MTTLNLEIAHQVRGRIRMKAPAAKRNPELLEQIKETFSVLPGIERITVNPTTGSIVLHYDEDRHDDVHNDLHRHLPQGHRPPQNEIDDFMRKLEDEAEFLAEHSQAARAVVDFWRDLDQRVKRASGNVLDLKILLAIAIIGFTVLEVGATAATPVWVTLVIFSLNHFIEMHHPGVAAQAVPREAPG